MANLNKVWRICIPAVILGSTGGFATAGQAAPGLLPGTYRCSAYNVSGGGGSCRNMPPLALLADGSYRFSSTRGQWTTYGGKLVLSESQTWGPGEILGSDAVRFEYDYREWRHTVTWTCRDCASATQGTADPSNGVYVGVSLTLQFAQQVGGVTGFSIVPVESARQYTHNATLPSGAVQGLAWEAGPTVVGVATNRDNKLMNGRRYVVFLAWPRESIPVAILEIPPTDRDYAATLPATLDGAVLAQLDGGHAPIAPPAEFPDQAPQALPAGTHSQFPPVPSDPPQGYPPPPPVTRGGMPDGRVPATSNGSAPSPKTGSGGGSGLRGFLNTMDQLGKALEGVSRSSVSGPPGYPASPTPTYDPGRTGPSYGAMQGGLGAPPPPAPRCDPQIPKYSQPGCVE